jgi:acetyltransferase-like isoleucine patch superfamily enzyme
MGVLVRDLWVNGVAAWPVWPGSWRRAMYRLYGMRIAASGISPRCFFGSPRVEIGAGTTVNYGCFFDSLGWIRIGRDCAIGMEVLFCSSTHEPGTARRRAGAPLARGVRVGEGCWIGARAILLPGVRVGDGCVIAAGAVVTADCAPHGLYAGVPARRIRDLEASSGPPETLPASRAA